MDPDPPRCLPLHKKRPKKGAKPNTLAGLAVREGPQAVLHKRVCEDGCEHHRRAMCRWFWDCSEHPGPVGRSDALCNLLLPPEPIAHSDCSNQSQTHPGAVQRSCKVDTARRSQTVTRHSHHTAFTDRLFGIGRSGATLHGCDIFFVYFSFLLPESYHGRFAWDPVAGAARLHRLWLCRRRCSDAPGSHLADPPLQA